MLTTWVTLLCVKRSVLFKKLKLSNCRKVCIGFSLCLRGMFIQVSRNEWMKERLRKLSFAFTSLGSGGIAAGETRKPRNSASDLSNSHLWTSIFTFSDCKVWNISLKFSRCVSLYMQNIIISSIYIIELPYIFAQ